MTKDLFDADLNVDPATSETPEVDLTEVKQKFGDNLDALTKAKAHSDLHIKNLENELSGLRKELETRLSLEQFMDEIKSPKSPSSNSQEHHPEQNEQDSEYVSRDEAINLAKEAIKQERTQSQKEYNRSLAAEGLRKAWGSNFQSKLADKARELGMSREQLNELASTSPQGFLAMVAAKGSSDSIPDLAPPRSSVQRPTGNQGQQDPEYFKKMRKDNPSLYWSPRTQKQIHALEQAAAARGESFYS